MTENRPRHLHDLTAEMPAIPRMPRHSAEAPPLSTTAIPRITVDRTQYPPLPAEWQSVAPSSPGRHASPEAWWRRAWRWVMGA